MREGMGHFCGRTRSLSSPPSSGNLGECVGAARSDARHGPAGTALALRSAGSPLVIEIRQIFGFGVPPLGL